MPKPPPAPPGPPTLLNRPLGFIGPLSFFLACAVFGALELNPSNDTWIGLAAGRQIAELGRVPLTDSFSFTAAGSPWLNQNWLAHRTMYWLYDRIGPDAVMFATWLSALVIFGSIAWTCFRRTRNWPPSLVIAGLAAVGCRDFLAPRPATAGLACAALLSVLLTELFEASTHLRRWLIGALLCGLMFIWGNSHGTFVVGYFTLAVYVALIVLAAGGRWRMRPHDLLGSPALPVLAAAIVSAILIATLGPFGWSNFWHPSKVAGSELFRLIPEWRSPFVYSEVDRARMLRFWLLLSAAVFSILFVAFRIGMSMQGEKSKPAPSNSARRWFDAVLLLTTLALSLWARRFAPLLYIFAAPACAALRAPAIGAIAHSTRIRASAIFGGVTALLAIGVGVLTWQLDYLAVGHLPPFPNLLEHFTRYDTSPDDAFQFLNRNELTANVFTENADSGALLYHAPSCRIFIDGRLQQVYEEDQFKRYLELFAPQISPPEVEHILVESGADVVLLRPYDQTAHFWSILEGSPQWLLVLLSPGRYGVFIRKGSPPFVALGERLRENREWRPDTAAALLGRGSLWMDSAPPNVDRAVECWRNAVAREPRTGMLAFRWIDAELRRAGRLDDAQRYLAAQAARLGTPQPDLSEADRRALLRLIEQLNTGR